jgi:hypothetical protein
MYKIDKKDYGYLLTFSGMINLEEMSKWVEDSKKALTGAPSSFGVIIDMRDLKPLAADVKKKMEEGQILYKEKGMARSAVILSSAVLTLQFKRIAQESGIYKTERYINASKVSNWEKVASDWVKNEIDPDK